MEKEIICLDSSILIDFFRKKKKENSIFYQLTQNYQLFATSVITEYEIFTGSTKEQQDFWEDFFRKIIVLPFDSETDKFAIQIYKELKSKSKLIEIPDILIAATALKNNMKLATINRKHFERIEGLELI
jgi:tRNA(fMet)-specific endonuclease VapC